MCAVCAQCASVRPIHPFYLTKREAPYNALSPTAAWGVILSVERWETLDQVLEIGRGGVFPNLTAEQFAKLTINR